LPALRERQDIERIIHKLHRRHRSSPQTLCTELLAQLMRYDWPGNLRELDNLMQVACLMAEGEVVLEINHLPDYLAQKLMDLAFEPQTLTDVVDTETTAYPHELAESSSATIDSLHGTINQNVLQAYHACEGNVSQCAKRLGISRNALYRKLKQLGIKD